MTVRLVKPYGMVVANFILTIYSFSVKQENEFSIAYHTRGKKFIDLHDTKDFTCMIRNGIKHTGTLFALAQTAMAPVVFSISWTRACKISSSARQTIFLFRSGNVLTPKVVFILVKIITSMLKHTFPSYSLTIFTSKGSSKFSFGFLKNKKQFVHGSTYIQAMDYIVSYSKNKLFNVHSCSFT